MRVVMVSKACVVGSYQSKLEALASKPGMELTLITPPLWSERGRTLRYEPLYPRGYRTLLVPQRLNGHYHMHWYDGLTKIMRRLEPDLVHIDEEPADLVAWQCQRAANLVGARSLFFTWQNIVRPAPPPFLAFQRYVFAHASAAICGNHDSSWVIRAKGYRGPVALIPQFGVDERAFNVVERPAGLPTVRIGYAGRLVAEKGVDLLIRALPLLGSNVDLVIQGSGPEENRLRSLAGGLPGGCRVTFIPNRPSQDMPAFYHSVDIVVLPSRTRRNWKEQWGRVVQEAMSCGLPVVVSDSGELSNVAGDGGLVFSEGDVAGLSLVLRRLIAEPGLRSVMGQRGRRRVLARFTQKAVAAATYGVYQRVLGERL